jgi:uncharacterized protein
VQLFRKSRDRIIVFIGKTGVGKSSSINAVFGLSFLTDPAVACTKKPQFSKLKDISGREYGVVDLPGIGESITADKRYSKFYKTWICRANVLVWITQADTRAYKQDELLLVKNKKFFRKNLKVIVGLNKIDYLEANFTEDAVNLNVNSSLIEKVQDVHFIFRNVLSDSVNLQQHDIIPYSAAQNLGIERLKQRILKYV